MGRFLVFILLLSYTLPTIGQIKPDSSYTYVDTMSQHKVSTKEGYYMGDTKFKVELYKLKKGYVLISKETDSLDYLLIQFGKTLTKIDSEDHHLVTRWLEKDGANYFVIYSRVYGSGCHPMLFDFFNKESKSKMFSVYGDELYKDTLRGLYVFDQDIYHYRKKERHRFIIYDLKANKYESFKEPTDNPEIDGCIDWGVVKLSSSELKITYKNVKGKEKALVYKRLNKQ